MIKVIIYDEACEVLSIEKFLKDDVCIVCYLKNDVEYFNELLNEVRVYGLNDMKNVLEEEEFDYIIINSRRSSIIYDKLRENGVNVNNILDVSFFFDDYFNHFLKDKLMICESSQKLDFDLIFFGRNYISNNLMKSNFENSFNLSNVFSDLHYDYHLIYYLVKNNKISEDTRIGIFTNYSMIYENIDFCDKKNDYINNFEDVFNIHNREKINSTYYSLCKDNFRENYLKVFKNGNLKESIAMDKGNISNDSPEKIMYDAQVETLNFMEANLVAFKMNKNILGQIVKLINDNNMEAFFIIPPVHQCYRTYINKTLQKEFYLVMNRILNSKISIFDYFDFEFNNDCFSSPNNLNLCGCEEFLKILSYDLKDKFLNTKACNNL